MDTLSDLPTVVSNSKFDPVAVPPAIPGVQEIHIAEYKQLKDEQRSRISIRDNLIYATLTSIAAVLLFVFNGDSHRSALLLLPPVCLILGWTYLMNDEKISAIGRYLRGELSYRFAGSANVVLLGWESAHRNDSRRTGRKFIQAIIDILLFCVTGIAAVAVCWSILPSSETSYLLIGIGCVEIIAMFFLAYQIILYAEVGVENP